MISIHELLISIKMARASIFIDIYNSFIDINKDGRRHHNFLISINHLLISINHLLISINELEISINELEISINVVSASIFSDINNSLIDINK